MEYEAFSFHILFGFLHLCYIYVPMERTKAQNILNEGFVHTVKDPLWQNIPMTKEIKALTEVDDVQKLARIKQNGPSYHIYPGCVHTRLSHSLGVYYLGRQILLSLSKKSQDLPFTEKGMMSFLVACLLHDIGHFPYAHSLKELAIRDHEELAGEMILEHKELGEAIDKTGADRVMTAAIIDKDLLSSDEETIFYRNVLSGTLDPDKLDYLSRDGFFAGVPYGKQDTDFIISSLSYHNSRLCLDKAAISSVEQILFSKYMMYRTLYWHKGVRSATAMIKKALITALKEGLVTFDELYGIDDNEFVLLLRERKDKCGALEMVEKVEHNHLFERKAFKDYESSGVIETKGRKPGDREEMERQIWKNLSKDYPDLKEWEVIIDIPEPISFETHISVLTEDGRVEDINDSDMVFSGKVSSLFQKSLRKVALYTPSYISEEAASRAMGEVIHG